VSYLESPEDTRLLLEGAGFAVDTIEERTEFALQFFKKGLATAADGPSPLGIHLVRGPTAREKFRNIVANIEAGRIAPVLITARR